MKILLLFILIGFFINSKDHEEKFLYDLSTNSAIYAGVQSPLFMDVEFSYDVRLYFLPKPDYYYIMKTPKYNNLEFYITVKKDVPTTDFPINFCTSNSRPQKAEEESLFECGNVLSVQKNHTKDGYDTYIYPYSYKTDKSYIALHVKNIGSLEYLGVYTHCLDKIFSINVNESYKVNMTQFEQQNLQAGHNYFFKTQVESNQNFGIKFSLYKNETSNYKIYISEYNENPSENEIFGGEGNYGNPLKGKASIENDYRNYEYQFTTSVNATYLVIRIDNYKDINYLQIQVYPQEIKEKSGNKSNKSNKSYGLIISSIIISILILAVVAFIILKYFGYFRKPVSSIEIQNLI